MRAAGVLVVAALASCATAFYPPAPIQEVRCYDAEHCAKVWAAAQTYLARASRFRVRLASDALIETFGPDGSPYPAWQITKIPKGEGATVQIRAICAITPYGCSANHTGLVGDFKTYLLMQ